MASSSPAGKKSSFSEWQTIQCRGTRNSNQTQQPPMVKAYNPYPTQGSFAQVLLSNPSMKSSSTTNASTRSTTPQTTPPQSPTSQGQDAHTYISPYSPTGLRFPPSSKFTEWKGRCFKCCRTGHNKADCRNPLCCGKCWKSGHTGTRCSQPRLNPDAPAYIPAHKHSKSPRGEPGFADLLSEPFPRAKAMPEGRPDHTTYYVTREEPHFQEMDRLTNAVVMVWKGDDLTFEPETVANYAVRTGIVKKDEISIAILKGGRYLIHLPTGLAPDTFIRATPQISGILGFPLSHGVHCMELRSRCHTSKSSLT